MSFNNQNIIPKEHFEILNLDRNKFLSIEDALSITHVSESTSASVFFNKNIKKHRHQYSDSFKVNNKRININKAIIKEKCKSNNNNKSKFLVNFTLTINETKRFDAFGNPIDKNKKQRVSFIDQIFDNNNNNNNDNKNDINNDNLNNNNIKNNVNNNIIMDNNENNNNNNNNNNNKNLVEYDNIESFKLYNKIMSYKYNLREQIEKKQICCSTCILF